MAVPPESPGAMPRIVADPEASLTPRRLHHPPPPRLWPLWLLILVLSGGLTGLAWLGWESQRRFEEALARTGGEISNLHARFDAGTGPGETLEAMLGRLAALEVDLGRLDARLAELVEAREEDRERLDAQGERLSRIGEAAATREAVLEATRVSLDALERAGEEGRGALAERLAALNDAGEEARRRLAALEARLEDLAGEAGSREELAALAQRLRDTRSELEERLTAQERETETGLEHLAARLADLDQALEALPPSRDDEQRIEALAGRLQVLEADIGELRRAQLALSARLEALRP